MIPTRYQTAIAWFAAMLLASLPRASVHDDSHALIASADGNLCSIEKGASAATGADTVFQVLHVRERDMRSVCEVTRRLQQERGACGHVSAQTVRACSARDVSLTTVVSFVPIGQFESHVRGLLRTPKEFFEFELQMVAPDDFVKSLPTYSAAVVATRLPTCNGVGKQAAEPFCGATQIGPRALLTAAHCVVDRGVMRPVKAVGMCKGGKESRLTCVVPSGYEQAAKAAAAQGQCHCDVHGGSPGCAQDVAVCVPEPSCTFDEPKDGFETLRLQRPTRGANVTAIGFHKEHVWRAAFKQTTVATLPASAPQFAKDAFIRLAKGSTGEGDSGSPLFDDLNNQRRRILGPIVTTEDDVSDLEALRMWFDDVARVTAPLCGAANAPVRGCR